MQARRGTNAAHRRPAAVAVLDGCLAALELPVARPAVAERGVTLPCEGWPLHVGAAVRGGLLEVRAEALAWSAPGAIDPWGLLHRNRRDLRLVRYATSGAGAVWVHGELPAAGLVAASVDELLARLYVAAQDVRRLAARAA